MAVAHKMARHTWKYHLWFPQDFELRNLSPVFLYKMTLICPSNPRRKPPLPIYCYYNSTAKYHDDNDIFKILTLWTINERFCRVNLLRKKSKMATYFTFKWANKQNCYQPTFLVCHTRMLNLLCLYDFATQTIISDVYFSSSDLYFIVKAVVLHIYN